MGETTNRRRNDTTRRRDDMTRRRGGNNATPRHPDEAHRTARWVLRADDNNRAEPQAALLVSFPFFFKLSFMYPCTTPGEG